MLGYVVKGEAGTLENVPLPTPGEDEALVRVLIAGVCNTGAVSCNCNEAMCDACD